MLHDVFGVDFPQIAATLERSEAAARQLASRARRQVRDCAPRRSVDPATHRRTVEAFAAAVAGGDIAELMKLLDPAIVWHSDGGGKANAGVRPVLGADRVARLVAGVAGKYLTPGITINVTQVNGEPGLVIRHPDGTPGGVIGFCVEDGLITEAYIVVNPDKLSRVPSTDGPVLPG